MTLGETISLISVTLAALGVMARVAHAFMGSMLDRRFDPLQKSLDALTVEVRRDLDRIVRAQEEHAHRISALEVQTATLKADKVDHAHLHQVIRSTTGG